MYLTTVPRRIGNTATEVWSAVLADNGCRTMAWHRWPVRLACLKRLLKNTLKPLT